MFITSFVSTVLTFPDQSTSNHQKGDATYRCSHDCSSSLGGFLVESDVCDVDVGRVPEERMMVATTSRDCEEVEDAESV